MSGVLDWIMPGRAEREKEAKRREAVLDESVAAFRDALKKAAPRVAPRADDE